MRMFDVVGPQDADQCTAYFRAVEHMSHLGHTLVGDITYGARPILPRDCADDLKQTIRTFKRQALHAKRLEFFHPSANQLQTFTADPPNDFKKLVSELQLDVQK